MYCLAGVAQVRRVRPNAGAHRWLRRLAPLASMAVALAFVLVAHAQSGPADAARQAQELDAAGLELWRSGELEDAVTALTQAILVRPDWAKPYRHRALARIGMGDYEGGLADAQRAFELLFGVSTPVDDVAGVMDTRGYAYLKLEQYANARTDFTASISLTSNVSPATPLGRGIASVMLGDQENGILDLEWGLLMAPLVATDPQIQDLLDQTHGVLRTIIREDESPTDGYFLLNLSTGAQQNL